MHFVPRRGIAAVPATMRHSDGHAMALLIERRRGLATLASHSGRTSADGSPGLADGGSCHAYAVNAGPAYPAGGGDFRDHAVRLNNRHWRHRLRRYRNRQGEASNGNQLSIT